MNFRFQSTRVRSASAFLVVVAWLGVAPAEAAAPRGETGASPSEDPFAGGAQYLGQLVQLAALDPNLAASLVPEPWIVSVVEQVMALGAETASVPAAADPPRDGRIGPWSSTQALARSIESVDPRAAGGLVRALRPRIAAHCRSRGIAMRDYDAALRAGALRLSTGRVLERAVGGEPSAITPTQRELARLGVPVVLAVRGQALALGNSLWGDGWSDEASR